MATQTEVFNEFDPVQYSTEELQWLLENIDKPPVVALRTRPANINANAVRPLLMRVQELTDLEQHEGIKWNGVGVIKQAITTYLEQDSKWEQAHRIRPRTIPRFPSLYSWDAKGRPHRGGPGSDSDRVRTYFGPKGERIPFAVALIPEFDPDFVPPVNTEGSSDAYLVDDTDMLRWECRVPRNDGTPCGHTESYKQDSRSSRAAARARISKHLKKAVENVDLHREVHTNEFGA